MNIFATSSDPKQSAIWLDDKRLNKMVTESAQIICTVLAGDGVKRLPFKPTHEHHPIVKWADNTPQNLYWLSQHHVFLYGEWLYRFEKSHASGLKPEILSEIAPAKPPKTFQNSAKNDSRMLDFTWCDDVHLAYRMYLTARWINDSRPPRWTKRREPDWRMQCGEDHYFDLCRRALQNIQRSSTEEIVCPRCGDEINCKDKGRLISIRCKTPGCIVWDPI